MGKSAQLSKYIAWLRHNHTNYDKYLRIMYDDNGKQTEMRRYINEILYRVMTDKIDATEALQNIRHIIKVAGYKEPPKPTEKTLSKRALILENKRARRRRNKAKREERKADDGFNKAIKKHNNIIDGEERKIHKQYVQVMLYQIGLSNYQLRKKLLPQY